MTAAILVASALCGVREARADDSKEALPTSDAPVAGHPQTDPNSPVETEHQAYRFIGLRFRDVIVPKFMIDIFADGGATVNVAMFGPEFAIRKDHLEIDFAAMYADYSMKPFLFKGKSDGDESYEIVSSSLKLLYLTVELLYDVPIDDGGRFSFLVGGGIGLAPVFGSLYRNQAFPNDANNIDPNDISKWKPCVAPGNPATKAKSDGQPYCDSSNTHYGGYAEPSWANGGSKPVVFPWLSLPQLSFRYKPLKQLQTRADVGFSITGFYFGFAAAYGL